ncbi:hypothetical protein ACIBKY_51525 [Nonomuraea sp. NPDC050394]|uniref:hypothetical protein n=1 Tax=Nonomuraea sp. NPDC050394 TaxID=3364363 RepID=UPI00378B8557
MGLEIALLLALLAAGGLCGGVVWWRRPDLRAPAGDAFKQGCLAAGQQLKTEFNRGRADVAGGWARVRKSLDRSDNPLAPALIGFGDTLGVALIAGGALAWGTARTVIAAKRALGAFIDGWKAGWGRHQDDPDVEVEPMPPADEPDDVHEAVVVEDLPEDDHEDDDPPLPQAGPDDPDLAVYDQVTPPPEGEVMSNQPALRGEVAGGLQHLKQAFDGGAVSVQAMVSRIDGIGAELAAHLAAQGDILPKVRQTRETASVLSRQLKEVAASLQKLIGG